MRIGKSDDEGLNEDVGDVAQGEMEREKGEVEAGLLERSGEDTMLCYALLPDS